MSKKENSSENLGAEIDNFWLSEVYPDAGSSLDFCQAPVEQIRDNAIVVLDTNVLLLPYRLGAQSLQEIQKVLSQLTSGDRIFLPAQAAREFLKNRAGRVRDVLRDLERQASQIQIMSDRRIGFLDTDQNYENLIKYAEEVRVLKQQSLDAISKISSKLKSGIGDDPVSAAFREIFKDKVVDIDCQSEIDKRKITEEMAWRYAHDIPPGYKDQSKGDGGIGDFLIWKTILKLGEDRKTDCIFVTEDSKGDWWVQSEGTFQPRIELVEEYRRATQGRTIHLMSLSHFLSTFGAEERAVDETQQVEKAQRDRQRAFENNIEVMEQENSSLSPNSAIPYSSSGDVIDSEFRSLLKKRNFLSMKINDIISKRRDIDIKISNSDLDNSLSDEDISSLIMMKHRYTKEFIETSRERGKLDEIMNRFIR